MDCCFYTVALFSVEGTFLAELGSSEGCFCRLGLCQGTLELCRPWWLAGRADVRQYSFLFTDFLDSGTTLSVGAAVRRYRLLVVGLGSKGRGGV